MPATRKPRKAYRPRPLDCDPVETAIARACLMPPKQRGTLAQHVQAAFDAFRTGHGTLELWRVLADHLNVAEALSELSIVNDQADAFTAAQQALAAVHARREAGRSWTLYPAEITTLDDAVWLHTVQLQHATQGEMQRAIDAAARRTAQALAGNAGPGTTVCLGNAGAAA